MSNQSEVSNWKYSHFLKNERSNFNKNDILSILPKQDIDLAYNTISKWDNYLPTPLISLNKLSEKLNELENSLTKPIFLLKNIEFPFFDTSHSNNIFNSISLINLNTVKDFEKKIDKKVEFERFRGNFYINELEAGEERNWIGKIIKINNVSFRVEKDIPRCVAINLKPKTDDNSLNLLKSLKKTYNHFDMGIYLHALEDGKINVGDKIQLSQ